MVFVDMGNKLLQQPTSVDRIGGVMTAKEDRVQDYRELATLSVWNSMVERAYSAQAAGNSFKVLDVCCGTGRWTAAFSDMVTAPRGLTLDCDYVDYCEDSLKVLRERVPSLLGVRAGSMVVTSPSVRAAVCAVAALAADEDVARDDCGAGPQAMVIVLAIMLRGVPLLLRRHMRAQCVAVRRLRVVAWGSYLHRRVLTCAVAKCSAARCGGRTWQRCGVWHGARGGRLAGRATSCAAMS